MALCHYTVRMEKEDKKRPIQPNDKYIVRFPDGMRDRIAEIAKENGRSMNAEIVARLEESLAKESELTQESIAALLQQQEERLKHWMTGNVLGVLHRLDGAETPAATQEGFSGDQSVSNTEKHGS